MIYTRRDIGRIALAALPAARLAAAAKPNSNFGGVRVGAITYSFRALPCSVEQLLGYCVECGISGVEMLNTHAEPSAGAPPAPAAGGGRAQMTPERQAARQKAAEELTKWRLSVPMDKYKAMRAMYNDAGVRIYALNLVIDLSMKNEECDYVFNAAKALGCTYLTMELPTDPNVTKRVGEFATKHKMMVGYHAHMQATDVLWDTAMAQSKYNGISFDIGHYVAGTSQNPIPFIQKHHDRIACLHLKDRRKANGPNVPWGQGDTPIKEVLQLMRKDKYKFPAFIEYEYSTPEGSSVLAEIKKCVAYSKAALA